MKKKVSSSFIIALGSLLFITNSCKKEDKEQIPSLTTTEASAVTKTSAVTGGYISSDGGLAVIARGTCYSLSKSPTLKDSITIDGSDDKGFRSIITSLTPNTTYYFRAYATNSNGTAYGSEFSFKTLLGINPETVTDFDGNIYHTVNIGSQVWMIENLKVTHYRNGDEIPNITDNYKWINTYSGICSDYNNNPNNSAIYGKLYNGHTISDNRKIAPPGWHVTTTTDWTTLIDFLIKNGYGFQSDGNDIAKSLAAITGWSYSLNWGTVGRNPGTNNGSGFTALPGGYRNNNGAFNGIGEVSNFWSPSANVYNAFCFSLSSYSEIIHNELKDLNYGYAIRCLKD